MHFDFAAIRSRQLVRVQVILRWTCELCWRSFISDCQYDLEQLIYFQFFFGRIDIFLVNSQLSFFDRKKKSHSFLRIILENRYDIVRWPITRFNDEHVSRSLTSFAMDCVACLNSTSSSPSPCKKNTYQILVKNSQIYIQIQFGRVKPLDLDLNLYQERKAA